MAATIRESKTVLTAEDKTAGAFASLQRHVTGAQASLSSMHAALLGLAGGAVVGGFSALVKNGLEMAESMNKLSQKTGIAVEELSQLSYAAKLADVSNETLTKGVKGLSEMMVKASDATSIQAATMKALGVDLKAGVAPALEKIADQFAKLPDGEVKATLATQLFNKAGLEMIPMLNQGSAGIRAMKEEADALGLTLSAETAANAERFNDNMKAIGSTAAATATALAGKLAASLADVSAAMKEAQREGGTLLAMWVGLGGAAAKLFTDDSLTAAEKVQKRMNEVNAELVQLKQRLEDSQNVMGPWGERLRASIIAGATKGVEELRALNQQLIDITKSEQAAAAAAKQKAADKKAEEERIRQLQARFDAEKKAREEVSRWNDRLAKEDIKGWVAYADAVFDESDKMFTELAKVSQAYWDNEEKLKKADIKGWVEYIEAGIQEYEKELTEAGKLSKSWHQVQDKALAEQAQMYDDLAQSAGSFFADLVMNGKSAFDNLKQSLKSFAAELIALFAKRWILNMAGNMIGGNTGSMLMQMGSTVGNNTLSGSLLNAGGSQMMALGAAGILGGAAGYFGSGAMGAGERGQKVGGITGATGAMIGMQVFGPIGAAIGALAGALIGKFTDPDGLAQRSAMFGSRSSGTIPRSATSAFGTFGVYDDKWFGDDMNDKIKAFLTGLAELDDGFAKFLTTTEIDRVKAALKDAKSYGFGEEHSDFSGTLGQILNDRITAVFNAIDPSLTKWLDGFKGTGEELAAYAQAILQVRQALASSEVESLLGRIPELTIEGLSKIQEAGESLSDTFMRVVGEFLTAQNNLNAAIGSRNPQFARDLVLSQRNGLAAQFATLVGRDFGDALLSQMALQPETFTNLNTAGMNLLANFLGLQSSLEQLDAQLAGSGTSAVVNFTNALVTSASAITDARASLADYLNGSLLADNSPLNPMARYQEAKRQYQANLGLAQLDNVDAISNFGRYREAFLDASRAIFASSGQYNTDFFGTFNEGANLPNSGVRPYTAADAQQQTDRSIAAMTSVGEKTAQVTQAVVALAQAVIANASQNTAETKAVLDDQLLALNKIASGGGVLASSGALP